MPLEAGYRCPDCRSEVAPGLLACPGCQRLVYGVELRGLAEEARVAADRGDLSGALAAWRSAHEKVPPESSQAAAILARIHRLSKQLDRGSASAVPKASRWSQGGFVGALGAGGLLVWKFKAAVLFLLGKGKLLLLGLTKGGTLLSMLASLGLYWALWGWPFALGLVLSIYVHEMGHVFALSRLGIKASAPAFIPGFGALIRLKQYPASSMEDARVGLAGPIWGLGAALATWFVFLVSGAAIWGAIAHVGAWLNLFNLLPISPLDGGRGFRALSAWQRALAAAVLGAMWWITGEGLLLLLLLVAVVRALRKEQETAGGDSRAFLQYVGLIVALALLCAIPLPELGSAGAGLGP